MSGTAPTVAPRAVAVRKVLRRLMPLLFMGAVLAHLDRVNVSMASLQMLPDIRLSPAAYGFGVGTFFIAYALFEVPSNVGLARFGARRWIARIMMTWGLVSASTAFIAGPTSFFVNRILLGIAEAGFLPGVLVYLAAWLPAEHRGRAFATFLMAIPVANVIGGPLAGGLMLLDGFAGLRGWQWLFILEGLAPVLLSVFIWRSLRDTPADAEWLTAADVAALADETGKATEQHRLTARTIFRAIAKPRILLFTTVIACLGGINYALTFWLPQVVKGIGFSTLQTGFVVAVPYLFGAGAMVLWGAHSDRTGERRWHLALPAAAAGIALATSVWLSSDLARMALITLALTCIFAAQGIFWSAVSSALAGDERTIGMAAISAAGVLFAFAAPSLVGLARQMTGGFELAFVILGLLGVIGGGLAVLMATHGLTRSPERPDLSENPA